YANKAQRVMSLRYGTGRDQMGRLAADLIAIIVLLQWQEPPKQHETTIPSGVQRRASVKISSGTAGHALTMHPGKVEQRSESIRSLKFYHKLRILQ
ncbi:MAG: hypothetical protein KDH90_26080, partial [Anaerolineae bacterium]|nr:hypothetical protein [Anaerolineae bacterium]